MIVPLDMFLIVGRGFGRSSSSVVVRIDEGRQLEDIRPDTGARNVVGGSNVAADEAADIDPETKVAVSMMKILHS